MFKVKLIFILLIINYQLSIVNCFAQCGDYRWDVKTLSDADTVLVNFGNIVKTTISLQRNMPKPEKLTKDLQRLSSETTVYSIDCYVIGFKREKDMDVYMVLKDLDSNITMVAQYPSPHCPEVRATGRYNDFLKLNEWFLKYIGSPTSRYKSLSYPVKVRVIGVGMFDHYYEQKGMAPNGREIHPVLKMKLLNN